MIVRPLDYEVDMIKLKHPANVGGTIKPAGSIVTGLTPEQERKFIDAGTAEYPVIAAIKSAALEMAKAKAEEIKPLAKMTNDELDELGTGLGLDMSEHRVKADKIAAIEAAQAEAESKTEETKPLAEMTEEELDKLGAEMGLDMSECQDTAGKIAAIEEAQTEKQAANAPAAFGRPSAQS